MKQLLLLSFLACCLKGSSQTTTKQQDIQKLLTAFQIKATMESMVNHGIELYKKQKPTVPQPVWDEIKNSVNYDIYLKKIATIFNDSYTQPEIKHLLYLADNAKPGTVPKLKPAVKERLYNASNGFGNQFAELINQRLKNKGY